MEFKLNNDHPSTSAAPPQCLTYLHALKQTSVAYRLSKNSSFQQLSGTKCGKFRRKLLGASCIITDTSLREFPVDSVLPPKTRRLILLRHGKSSWADSSLKDHDRPLNEQGRVASASLASKLQLEGWLPDLILSSDSLRTRETLDVMKENVPEFSEAEVHFLGSFYSVSAMDGQTADHIQETICKYAKDEIYTVMCMGHNRGWEEAASVFSGLSIELKTANAALLQTSGGSWQEAFESGAGSWTLSRILKPDNFDTAPSI